nr:ABC transporter substrate-binding protein [Micromonospora sp. DSM 115978]
MSTWGEYVQTEGGTRAAVLTPSLSSHYAMFSEKMTASLEAAGVEVAMYEEVVPGVTNIGTLVERMRTENIDTIAGALTPEILGTVVPAVHGAGLPLEVVLAPSGYDPILLQLLGPQLAGTSFFLHVMPFELNLPAHRALIDAMIEYAPQIQPPNRSSALVGWLSADMLIRGIQEAGDCLSREN